MFGVIVRGDKYLWYLFIQWQLFWEMNYKIIGGKW